MKCFYHSADLDGHCAGAIVKKVHPGCQLIGIDYGEEFPWPDVQPMETAFMVDFSLQPFGDMELLNHVVKLVWIDHHESAIQAAREAQDQDEPGSHIDGTQLTGQAACELCWHYFFPEKPMPMAVRLLGRYDVWDLDDPLVMPFQMGMRAYDTNPENVGFWYDLLSLGDPGGLIPSICKQGKKVQAYMEKQFAECCRSAFDIELDGLKCLAVNVGKPFASSQLFDSAWDPGRYDAMVAFARQGTARWTVHLYTTHNIDLSKVARARGGGGHQKAAGFICEELPF